ncbi:MAG: ADP-forming succinate--CoA ligase subunit beta [Bacteroidales bacterium]|nr:ADP-forming succinate--CoA ligase subunit beta [Bacteroidales bacterium]
MKIHEYQGKELFDRMGVPTAKGKVCRSVEEVLSAYEELGLKKAVVKAQVLTGGRGKAGGIKIGENREEVAAAAKAILGMEIKGLLVDRVMVAEAVEIASEYYFSFAVDRNSKSVVMILSREGGVEIEEVAAKTPEKIEKIPIFPFVGIPDFLAKKAAAILFDDWKLVMQGKVMIQNLYKLMVETDASLVEVNPLVVTKDGRLIALDAKLNFDDNALFRQPEIESLFEPDEEEKREQEAKANGFSFVHLGGEIGCMVNGAGLAMATMDLIKLYGGKPANFLDIGGSSNPRKVIEAMKLLLSDKDVKVVLINIFGGITRCDDVARGLITAFNEIKTDIPIVIRLTGTNEKEGRKLLEGTPFHSAETMGDAIKKAVALV